MQLKFNKITFKTYQKAAAKAADLLAKKWINEQDKTDIEWVFMMLNEGQLKSAESCFYALETHPRDMAWQIAKQIRSGIKEEIKDEKATNLMPKM